MDKMFTFSVRKPAETKDVPCRAYAVKNPKLPI